MLLTTSEIAHNAAKPRFCVPCCRVIVVTLVLLELPALQVLLALLARLAPLANRETEERL